MAPNVELHFWPANDLNGGSILTITDEDEYLKEVKLRITLDELGFGEFTLARKVGFALFDSGAVQPEVFVRVLVHAYSSTEYLWGFSLDKRHQVVVHKDEDGEEEFRFGGPGPKFYLDRAALQPEQFTGTGWLIDLENGVFRWNELATAGKVLNKLILEDAASDAPALPDLTKSFTNGADSDSVSWTTDIAGPGEFEVPIGQSLLKTLWELEDLSDLRTTIYLGTVASPVFRLDAWNAFGEDVSGSAFGVGVCRLVEGVNIVNDSLVVEGTSLRHASHVMVEGKDGVWATAVRSTWDPGEYVKWAKIGYPRSSNVTILERAGLRWLRKQDNGSEQITVDILPGADDATGLYFPKPTGPLWIGNTVALHTGGDVSWTPLDYRNADQLVTGLELELGEASVADTTLHKTRSWKVRVQLNYERGGAKSPGQGTSEGGTVGGLKLCTDTAVTIETSTLWKVSAAGAADAGFHEPGFDDSALANAVHATAGAGGFWVDGSSERWIWNDADATAASGEQRNFRTTFDLAELPSAAELEVSADNGCRVYLNGTLIATKGGAEEGAADASPFNYASIDTVTVDPALFAIGENVLSIEGWNETAGSPGPGAVYAALTYDSSELVGTSARAARCDHGHHHSSLLERDVAGAHSAAAVTYDPSGSPLTETDLQAALDEHANDPGEHGGGSGPLEQVKISRANGGTTDNPTPSAFTSVPDLATISITLASARTVRYSYRARFIASHDNRFIFRRDSTYVGGDPDGVFNSRSGVDTNVRLVDMWMVEEALAAGTYVIDVFYNAQSSTSSTQFKEQALMVEVINES